MVDQRFIVGAGAGPLDGYLLRDTASGAEARVLPALGANCVDFRVRGPNGEALPILYSPADPEQLRSAPARYGLPLLFPFPNRVRGGRYEFGGQAHQLTARSHGNAIHGLVISQPFRVEAAEATAQGAHLRCVIAHADLADAAGYPFPFRFVADYYLRDSTLTLTVTAANTGETAMPIGFGIHPYFRTPLLPNGTREACQISVPVRSRWLLGPDLIPTGERQPLGQDEQLTTLQPLGDRTFDDVYGDVIQERGGSTCRLVDPAGPVELAVESDANFREVVVYAPPGLPALCFEPYTCTTDAFNLQERGVDAGRIMLQPGQSWSGTIRLVVR